MWALIKGTRVWVVLFLSLDGASYVSWGAEALPILWGFSGCIQVWRDLESPARGFVEILLMRLVIWTAA